MNLNIGQKAKKGGAKKKLDLTQYIHSRGARSEAAVEDGEYKWDFEIFSKRMESLRGWSMQKRLEEWKDLKHCDMNGRGADPERKYVPSNLIGEDREWNKKVAFEEKSIAQSSKLRGLSPQELEEAHRELARGHSSDVLAGASKTAFARDITAPLPANSITCAGAGGSGSVGIESFFLAQAAAQEKQMPQTVPVTAQAQVAPQGSANNAGVSGGLPSDTSANPSGNSASSPAKIKSDIGSVRNNAYRDLNNSIRAITSSLEENLQDALVAYETSDPEKDGCFRNTLIERCRIVLLLLGKEYSTQDVDGDGKKTVTLTDMKVEEAFSQCRENTTDEAEKAIIEPAAPRIDGEAASIYMARLGQAMLQAAVSKLGSLAVEKPDNLQAQALLKCKLSSLAQLKTQPEIEQEIDSLQSGKDAAQELATSMKTALKDLKTNISKRDREDKKAERAEARRKAHEAEESKKKALKTAREC